jgi:endoglucanase
MINKIFTHIFCFLLLSFSSVAQQNIQLNQLGFYVNAPKFAVVRVGTSNGNFYVLTSNKNDTVFTGLLSKPQQSLYSSTITRIADFSKFRGSGKFVISVANVGNSYTFEIKDNALHDVAEKSLKAFYYQRVSMPLEEKYAGKWHRPAGDDDTAVFIHPSAATTKKIAGSTISIPGGWYDAGDLGKYIVNAGISTSTLLSAYEDYKNHFDTLHTNIPESGNGIPDILNEILYEVRWMLTMQDADDGGVYTKCNEPNAHDWYLPGKIKTKRYVVQKGTTATLDFAAVMAQCARVCKAYKKELPGLSDSCLRVAEYAWQWALKNPAIYYVQDSINKLYEPKILTGDYADADVEDEWFWAACELYVTTKKTKYLQEVENRISTPFALQLTTTVSALGYYTLLRNSKEISINVNSIRNKVLAFADTMLKNGNKAFATIMGQSKENFSWGSNIIAANQSMVLLKAYQISGKKKYIDAALTNLDYILGRNATGYCFVTGLGSKSTMHPSHSASMGDGIVEPVPGLMAGGPNPNMEDRWIDTCHYHFTEPETAYLDMGCAYASNEPAIDGNAALVYISNAFEALQYIVEYSKRKALNNIGKLKK